MPIKIKIELSTPSSIKSFHKIGPCCEGEEFGSTDIIIVCSVEGLAASLH